MLETLETLPNSHVGKLRAKGEGIDEKQGRVDQSMLISSQVPEEGEWQCPIVRVSTSIPGNCALPFNKKADANLFLMVKTGKCEVVRNGEKEVYQAGQLILMFAGDAVEEIESDYSFTADVVEFDLSEKGKEGDLASKCFRSGHQRLSSNNLLVPTLLKKVVRSAFLNGKRPSWKEQAWLKVALLELVELQNPTKQETTGLHESELHQLCEGIRSNPHLSYSNTELAGMLKLSLGHFVRLFRLHQDMSPREFVIQARMDKAKVLLKTTSLNISEISEATGYRDVYHFSRQFRQKVGSSPSGYRNDPAPIVEG